MLIRPLHEVLVILLSSAWGTCLSVLIDYALIGVSANADQELNGKRFIQDKAAITDGKIKK